MNLDFALLCLRVVFSCINTVDKDFPPSDGKLPYVNALLDLKKERAGMYLSPFQLA